MPSNVVHNYFAQSVKQGLKEEIVDIINSDEEAYLVGAQGPDLLFYLRYEKEPLPHLGEQVHKSLEPFKIFNQSAIYAKGVNSKSLTAFLLGQLCHYILDANVHPYVFHRELDLPNYYTKGAHKYIHVVFESALDYVWVRDYHKVNTKTYKGYKNLNCSNESRMIMASYYCDVVAPMFEMNLTPELGNKMILLMRKFMRICDDRTGIKYLIIRGIEKIMGHSRNISAFIRPRKENSEENWLNHLRVPYPKYRYENIMSTNTLEEMIDIARLEAIDIINNFYDYINSGATLDDKLYYRNYLGERRVKGV